MAMTPLPTAPSRSDSNDVFVARSDAFVAALPGFVTEANALETNVVTKEASAVAAQVTASTAATNAGNSATAAASSAALAASYATAALWVSGTTYAVGNVVISPANYRTYRRIVAGAGTTDPSLDAVNWTLTVVDGKVDSITLNGVSKVLPAITIVAFAEFDNSKDPEWLDKCAHTSWYNEARSAGKQLGSYATVTAAVAAGGVTGDVYYNTTSGAFHEITGATTSTATYRAGLQKFPMRGFVTAESARVIIWDTTHGTPTMWGVLPNSFGTISSVAIKDHILVIGSSTGVWKYDFVSGAYTHRNATNVQYYAASSFTALGTATVTDTAGAIVNAAVNSVAITYLPDAQINSYGVRVPTIYAATTGGLSRINSDGAVTSGNPSGLAVCRDVVLNERRALCTFTSSAGAAANGVASLQSHTGTMVFDMYPTRAFTDKAWPHLSVWGAAGGIPNPSSLTSMRNGWALNGQGGALDNTLALLLENDSTPAGGAVAHISTTYNTGYMVGDIRRAICYDSAGVLADRSVKASAGVTEVGTLTKTPVAGGRTVVSGMSSTAYDQEASHADFNALGTGDALFVHLTQAKWGTLATLKCLASLGDGASAGSFEFQHLAANTLAFLIHDGASLAARVTSTATFTDTAEHDVKVYRRSGTIYIEVDGVVVASAASALTVSNATGFLRIGEAQAASRPWVGGAFTVFKISATAPTAEQSAFIAACENELNGGAACLLSNSNSVSDLRCSDKSGILYVKNGTNLDAFHNLKRIDYATLSTGVTASGNKLPDPVLFTTGTTNTYVAPEIDVNAELTALNMQLAEAKQGAEPYQFTSSGTTQKLPQGFKATGWLFNSTDGTNLVVAQTFDGFCWTLSGLTTAKVYNAMIRRG